MAVNSGQMVDTRLALSLMRSIKLEDTSKLKSLDNRHPSSLVPLDYVRNILNIRPEDAKVDSEFMQRPEIPWMYLGRYVQSRYSTGDSIEDVFTKAICSNEEIDSAKRTTQQHYLMQKLRNKRFAGVGGSLVSMEYVADPSNIKSFNYFPRMEKGQSQGMTKEEIEVPVPGYSENLDPAKKRIIDRAVLLYLMSDKDGKLNVTNYDHNNYNANAISGEEAK